MAETIVVTYQFVGQGQDAVLAMVDTINARLMQTAGAVSDSFAQIGKVGEGGGHVAGGGGEGAGDGDVHAHVVERGHVEELGKAALVANRSFEVLKVGIEGIGQALISGSLQSSIGAFQRFGSSVGEATGVAEGFLSKFGLFGVIGSAVAGTLGGMTVLFNELAQHMSENVLEFTELAKAAGMSTQQFANLEGAFLRAGVGMEQLHQIVRVTSNRIQAEWGDISRTVRDSADRQEEEGFRIEDANRKVADSYTMPAEAARKIEGAQLGAQTAKAAIPEAERTKESTELELFKAQLEYKRKYDESGHVRQTPLPVSPDDQLRLQEMERHADASHIEALRAREAEDDRNIKRAKMGAEAAQEQEAAIERNASPEAREGMERAPMEARAAQRAQFDSLMKDPRNLAAAIHAGGEGVDWRTVAAADIFRALTYMGGGTMMGTLSAASQFMNMPAVQGENFGATRSAVAQQFGARGNIAPIEEAIRKGEFQTVTPETLKTGAAMETALPDAEKVRDAWSTAAQEVRLGGIEAGKAFTPVAESTARGLGSIVENLGTKVKESVDAVSGIFGSITESGRGVISVFNAIGGGAKVTPDRFRPEKEAEVTGKITGNVVDAIKGAVTPTADFAHRFQPPGAAATGVPVNITTPVVNVNAGKTEGAPTHAYGGYITGPGTGTSDSIRAPWLSNGEYVIRADSVARVGVPFLDAINQGRGFFGGGPVGYADGGLVDPGAGSAGDDSNSLKPYTPSWSERLRYAVQDIMSGMGASKGYSQEFAEKAETLAGGAPVVGQAISANEAVRAYQRGDKIGTVLGALGALPIPGAAVEGGAARAVEADASKTLRAVGEEYRISTRVPWAKSVEGQAHARSDLTVGLKSAGEATQMLASNAEIIRNYPGIKITGKTPEDVSENLIQHVVGNLLTLHDAVPESVRGRSRLWYAGARSIVDEWSKEFNLEPRAIAGTLAALSPQKDWFQNVDLARRILTFTRDQKGTVFSPEMRDYAKGYIKNLEKDAETLAQTKPKTAATRLQSAKDLMQSLASFEGKTFNQISDVDEQAVWMRWSDEAHNPRSYPIRTPEGGIGATSLTGKGEPQRIAWGAFGEIAKAMSVIADPSLENISRMMGDNHKVRNFYNNIISPESKLGDVTIDTHVIAAGLLRPLGGGAIEVKHGLGISGPESSTLGLKGTYALYAEAYRRAAAARNILPREMQSITWEAGKGLFSPEFKRSVGAEDVEGIWREYQKGKIDVGTARLRVFERAGGIAPPEWLRSDSSADVAQGRPRDPGELHLDQLGWMPAKSVDRRARARDAKAAETPSGFSHGGLASPRGIVGYADGGFVGDDMTDAAHQGHFGELKPYTPSWSERIRATVQDLMSGMGASRGYSQEFGEKAETLAGFAPAVGQAAIGPMHPDHIHGIIQNSLEMAHQAGSPAAAMEEYDLAATPQFEKPFRAALTEMIAQRGRSAIGRKYALGGPVGGGHVGYAGGGLVDPGGGASGDDDSFKPMTSADILAGKAGPVQEARPYTDPTLGGFIGRLFEHGVERLGAGMSIIRRAGEIGETVGGVTGVDMPFHVKQAIRRGQHGDYLGAGLEALGALPTIPAAGIGGGVARAAEKGAARTVEPSLMPAIKFEGKVYQGDTHLEALGKIQGKEERAAATLAGENRGWITERGRFLDRAKSQEYANNFGLFKEGAPDWVHNAPEAVSEWIKPPPKPTIAPEPSILAYHGSPHDFEKFSSEHIGKGEGAQSYGHGLYFAESEGVARSYRDNLSASQMEIEGKPFTPGNYAITKMVASGKGDLPTLGENLRRYAEEGKTNPFSNHEDAIKIADSIQQGKFTVGELGHMYQVRIAANPEHFLDWDKPLSGQHEKVRDAISTYYPQPTTRNIGHNQNLGENLVDLNVGKASVGVFPESKIPTDLDALKHMAMMNDPRTGEGWYREISQQVAAKEQARQPNFDVYSPHDASQALRTAGIPGIRYLDQGSRDIYGQLKSAQDGVKYWRSVGDADKIGKAERSLAALQEIERKQTRNYVVFDENLINIEKKYAIGGMVGGGFSSSSFSFGGSDSSLGLPGSVSFSPDIGATVSYGGDDDDRSKDVFGHASGGMVGSTMAPALSAAAAFGGAFGQASAVPSGGLPDPGLGFASGGLVRRFAQGGIVTDDDINHMDQHSAINFLVDHDVMTRNEAGVMTTEDLQDAIRETKWYHPIQDAVTAPSASSSETSSIPTEATDRSYPYGHPPSAPASVPFAKPEPPEFVHYRADTGTNPDLAKLQIAYARGKISADELKRGMHISAASGITVPKLPLTNAEKLSRAASIPTSAPSPSGELPTVTYGRVLHVLPENAVMAEGSFKEHNEATIRNLVKTGVWTPERAQWERMNQSAIAQAGKAFGDKPRPLDEETEGLMKAYAGALGKPDYGYDAEGGVHILKQEATPKSSPAPVDLSTPFESLPKGHYQDKMVRDWRGLHTYFTEGFVLDSEAKHEGGRASRRKRRDSDEDMWNPERAGMSLGGLARVGAALGGLAIGFSGGGMIGAPAPASAAPLVAHIQRAAVSPPSDEAMWNPLHSVVGNDGYAMGGLVGGGTGALQPAGYHALDVRTNSGTIPTLVSESGLESIRRDAVLGKAISSGIKPSWWGG